MGSSTTRFPHLLVLLCLILRLLSLHAWLIDFDFDFSDPSTFNVDDLRLQSDAALKEGSSGMMIEMTKNSTFSTGRMTADIEFDGATNALALTLRFDDNATLAPAHIISTRADVKRLLTQEVAFGFSATTGSWIERHRILSWSFNSTTVAVEDQPREQSTSTSFWDGLGCRQDQRWAVAMGGPRGSMGTAGAMRMEAMRTKEEEEELRKWLRGRRGGGEQLRRHAMRSRGKAACDAKWDDVTVPVRRFGCCHKQLYDGNRERWIWDSLQGKNEVLRGATRSGRKGNAENWSSQGDKDDFYNELNTISEARHKNLVKLEGWCCHINAWNLCDFLCWYRQKHNITFFLVYELVRNGNLDDHLYGKKGTLQWPKRDIKPSNILLDEGLNAKLADFGLARITENAKGKLLIVAMGSIDQYIAPEYKIHGELELISSTDVYSFGLVLLEIACTRKDREQIWNDMYMNHAGVAAVADPNKLKGEFDKRQMERVIILGHWCSMKDPIKRPTMSDAMDVLQQYDYRNLPDFNSLR
uniref:Receptor protein kinase-related protein-like n=3 Tax=Oryza sativa subsp. japonica TaxID=39947 RepID=Q6YT83_ORYSJ|nr:receptor protein kinase-related protein-like [Oryza sativa Japonica Group]BAD31385.1 receptor protein kinase-related protein-like [Oryza sativa Japonica Group]